MQDTTVFPLAPMIRLPNGSGIRADLIERVGTRFDPDRHAFVMTVNSDVCGKGDLEVMEAERDRVIAERNTWSGGIDPSAVLGLEAAVAEANRQLEQRDKVINAMIGVIEHAELIHDLVVEALTIDSDTGEIRSTPHGTVEQVRAALDALARLIPQATP